jgi:hypothetical protein
MFLDDTYTPRRVRITSQPHVVSGHHVYIFDMETGMEIQNVFRAIVRLDARESNQVELSYHPMDATGMLLDEHCEPITKVLKSENPEVAITAFEQMPLAEAVAQCFHSTYERLAPEFGYETRKESAVAWKDVPENNKRLMIAVASEVLQALNFHGVNEENDG